MSRNCQHKHCENICKKFKFNHRNYQYLLEFVNLKGEFLVSKCLNWDKYWETGFLHKSGN